MRQQTLTGVGPAREAPPVGHVAVPLVPFVVELAVGVGLALGAHVGVLVAHLLLRKLQKKGREQA